MNSTTNGVKNGLPDRKQRTATTSSVPDGPHFCAWHQAGASLTAVTCTTPPFTAIFGKRTST